LLARLICLSLCGVLLATAHATGNRASGCTHRCTVSWIMMIHVADDGACSGTARRATDTCACRSLRC
jgi:hypothetical protein